MEAQFLHGFTREEAVRQQHMVRKGFSYLFGSLIALIWGKTFRQAFSTSPCVWYISHGCSKHSCLQAHPIPQSILPFTTSQVLSFYPFPRFYITRHPRMRLVTAGLPLESIRQGGSRKWLKARALLYEVTFSFYNEFIFHFICSLVGKGKSWLVKGSWQDPLSNRSPRKANTHMKCIVYMNSRIWEWITLPSFD